MRIRDRVLVTAILVVSTASIPNGLCLGATAVNGITADQAPVAAAPENAAALKNVGSGAPAVTVNAGSHPNVPECTSDQLKVYTPSSTTLSIAVAPDSAWRPVGGNVGVNVSGDSGAIAANLLWYRACFRRHDATGESAFQAADVMRWNAAASKGGITQFTVTVPKLSDDKSSGSGLEALRVLQSADLRVIAVDPRGGIVADVTLPVRIISVPFAVGIAVLVTNLALFVLWRFSVARGLTNGNLLLNIVATSKGYASLSQFQIMVWTLVTGAGAVYVISLSGNLINLDSQILILLGITGATVIGSKLADNRNAQASAPSGPGVAAAVAPAVPDGGALGPPAAGAAAIAPAVPDGGAAALVAPAVPVGGAAAVPAAGVAPLATLAASAATKATGTPAPPRRPKWSDLVIIETDGPPEIDVTRVQMFFFTVISASFVLIKVFGSHEIPEIPNGYVELMGISNGVYLTKKFVT
jgi:hypothetical protein